VEDEQISSEANKLAEAHLDVFQRSRRSTPADLRGQGETSILIAPAAVPAPNTALALRLSRDESAEQPKY